MDSSKGYCCRIARSKVFSIRVEALQVKSKLLSFLMSTKVGTKAQETEKSLLLIFNTLWLLSCSLKAWLMLSKITVNLMRISHKFKQTFWDAKHRSCVSKTRNNLAAELQCYPYKAKRKCYIKMTKSPKMVVKTSISSHTCATLTLYIWKYLFEFHYLFIFLLFIPMMISSSNCIFNFTSVHNRILPFFSHQQTKIKDMIIFRSYIIKQC